MSFFRTICLPIVAYSLLLTAAFADYAPGQLIVTFKHGVAVSAVSSLNAKYGVTGVRPMYADALAIRPDWTALRDDYVTFLTREGCCRRKPSTGATRSCRRGAEHDRARFHHDPE